MHPVSSIWTTFIEDEATRMNRKRKMDERAHKCLMLSPHATMYDDDWDAIIPYMKKNKVPIKTMSLVTRIPHSGEAWNALCDALGQCPELESVDMTYPDNEHVNRQPNDAFPTWMIHIPRLTSIRLCADWNPSSWHIFVAHLPYCRHLANLEIDRLRANLSTGIVLGIADALKTNRTLMALQLNDCNIIGSTALALADALHSNRTLHTLELWDNAIDDQSAIAFAQLLESNETLTRLNLGMNMLGTPSAFAFATAMRCNSTLTHLNLSTNPRITQEGHDALVKMLHENESLRKFNGYHSILNFTLGYYQNDAMWTQVAEKWSAVLGAHTSSLEDARFIHHEISPYLYKAIVRNLKIEAGTKFQS